MTRHIERDPCASCEGAPQRFAYYREFAITEAIEALSTAQATPRRDDPDLRGMTYEPVVS